MDRRGFFRSASAIGITVAVTGRTDRSLAPAPCSATGNANTPDNGGITCVPDESEVMKGFPPPADKQVTRENREGSQANMRWAMQHWRELFPTQRVRRSENPIILPCALRDIGALTFRDTTGQTTTVEQQLDKLDVNAFIVLTGGKITFEDYRHGMTADTPHFTASIYKSIVATVIAALIGDGLEEKTRLSRMSLNWPAQHLGEPPFGSCSTWSRCKVRLYWTRQRIFSAQPVDRARCSRVGRTCWQLRLPSNVGEGTQSRGTNAVQGSRSTRSGLGAEKATDKRFADLLHDRIWAKIGAEFDADATCDPLGHWTFYLSVTLRDLARWGLMCLNDGKVNGKQVVPARFFEDIRDKASVEKLVEAPLLGEFFPEGVGYRSFFYQQKLTGAIAAAGAMGQFCYIDRRHNTVVAFFSTTPPVPTRDSSIRDFEQGGSFERACRLEWERWHLCSEIARAAE